VYVEPGSTLPIDKEAMRQTGLALAKMQLTDPLSLFEDLGLPNATKRFNRLIKWLTDPKSMVQDLDDENFDRMAFMDLQVLINGDQPEVRNEITERYVTYFTNYIKTGDFTELDNKIQKSITDFLGKEVEVLKRKLSLEEATLPTPEEMAAGNQAAVDQAGQQQQIQAAQPQPQDPAAAAMASSGAAPAPAPGGDPNSPFNNTNLAPFVKQTPDIKTTTAAGL